MDSKRPRSTRPLASVVALLLVAGIAGAAGMPRRPGAGTQVLVAGTTLQTADEPTASAGTVVETVTVAPGPAEVGLTTSSTGVLLPVSTPPTTMVPTTITVPSTVAGPKTVPVRPVPTVPPPGAFRPDQAGLYLVNALTGAGQLVLAHYTFAQISFSPDGQRIVFSGRQGDARPDGTVPTSLWIVNVDGTGLTRVAADAALPEEPSWSPDGRWIAYYSSPFNLAGDEGLFLLDPHTNQHHQLAWVEQGGFPLEWSHDSAKIASASPNHHAVTVVDVPTGAVHEAPHAGPAYEVTWSPDDRRLIVSDLEGPTWITDAQGANGSLLDAKGRYARSNPTTPVASVMLDQSAYLVPLDGGPRRLVDSGADPIDWSADGHLLAAAWGVGIDVVDITTGTINVMVWSPNVTAAAAGWSPIAPVMAVVVDPYNFRRY
jgi:dipeptidyl aminopeptidase/acylaminoacyl peptidase